MNRAIIILLVMSAALAASGSGVAQTPDNPFTNAGGDGNAVTPAAPPPATETAPTSGGSGVPSGAPRPDAKPDFLLNMSKADCRRLIRRSDVAGADYVAGVDVRGNAVTGAELSGSLTAADILPKEIAFELSLNPLSYAGNGDLADVFSESSTSFGTIKFDLASGALTLDGKRLNGTTESEVLALCKSSLGL
ncbi:hypothetical protein HH303_05715 [Rhodospirillaceae bacterium KN72]|uniref:Uncharacterized protein n=1 Tax=Pacificispira spongiicola TaxID=2729598 RepID=A0A7Y0DYL4_9PROT|nr:hypothetical protein [Pacificispira spongiicola]NMM43963.1 hypothetical protein [Pacificispira spongiicola]